MNYLFIKPGGESFAFQILRVVKVVGFINGNSAIKIACKYVASGGKKTVA
jgi:hypothetical protein